MAPDRSTREFPVADSVITSHPTINARNECDFSHVRWIEPHAFVGVGQRSLPLRHLEPALRTVGPQCCVCRVDLDGLGVVNGGLEVLVDLKLLVAELLAVRRACFCCCLHSDLRLVSLGRLSREDSRCNKGETAMSSSGVFFHSVSNKQGEHGCINIRRRLSIRRFEVVSSAAPHAPRAACQATRTAEPVQHLRTRLQPLYLLDPSNSICGCNNKPFEAASSSRPCRRRGAQGP